MLKQRIVTAAILIPIVIGLIFFAEPLWFSVFFGLIVLIGAWEWTTICKFQNNFKYIYCLFLLIALTTLYLLNNRNFYNVLIVIGTVYWLLAAFIVSFYQLKRNLLPKSSLILSIIGLLILIPMWCGVVNLKANVMNGASFIMFLMLLVWIADTGAYFIGKKWGKRKLASIVSPGKTWEGIIAGLIFSMLFAILYIYGTNIVSGYEISFLLLCLITVLVSVLGDLMESMIKRESGIKDSGSILPGHGGVMDRIDSLTAAVPVFATGILFLGIVK